MSSARYTTIITAFLLFFCQLAVPSLAQEGITYDIKKPKEFENRTLRSEKPQKKFTAPRRFIQNTISHYNYFFNANNKLNDVLERAKLAHKDDFSQLIPFYNYSLDVTAADSIELDSVAFKAQTGIVLHDLRTDWADNMYLLWGASYYLQKQFDSAYLMFQFINYAFANKDDDGYYRAIGSARDGNSATSIATKEKSGFIRRALSEPPSRNDAFIWQIKNYLEQDRYSEASSLILALKNDTLFPKRLNNDLEEVQAYFFYRQKNWDSAAAHLELALSNAPNKLEQARWEYLIAQLYERTGKNELSGNYYAKSINHTTDPIMDVYARLGSVRVNKDEDNNTIDKNVATLVKMAKRDKYQDYRDIVYYMAAQMELQRDSTDAALNLLLKSTKYASNNPAQRNKAFLQLAELSYNKRNYRASRNFYDSLRLDDPELKDPEGITTRKDLLSRLITELDIIHRQDSLQSLAAMPEDQRKDLVKKLVRRLRKLQGLKDEGAATTTGSIFPTQQNAPTLFVDNSKKGEWYFYNSNLRQKGLTDFKSKWGTRPNTDNWRRSAAQSGIIRDMTGPNAKPIVGNASNTGSAPEEITFDALYARIPLTDTAMQQSNDSVANALFTSGVMYVQQMEDCQSGTTALEKLRTLDPAYPKTDEALFNLYYCATRNGNTEQAAALKKALAENFPDSRYTPIVVTGKNPQGKNANLEATRTYEGIYNQFIEGNFTDAIAAKRTADSIYGANYWTPQLLYIEAVYHIKQRDDSTAKTVLNNIIRQFEGTPLAEKAITLLDVLSRRNEIEEELRNLVINMPVEDTSTRQPVTITPEKPVETTQPIDTTAKLPVPQPPVVKDTTAKLPVPQPPVVKLPKPVIDTVAAQPVVKPAPALSYSYDAAVPHYVVLVLNKVDPIFVNEARNAFSRYNRDTYYNKQMQAELVEVDADNRLLLISPFKNAEEAIAYIDQTKPKTSSEIIPWLTGGKYSFSIITDKNLELLKNSKDLDKYRLFLEKNVPGKF